jgi:Kef-type K+ transport system membrane component KefB
LHDSSGTGSAPTTRKARKLRGYQSRAERELLLEERVSEYTRVPFGRGATPGKEIRAILGAGMDPVARLALSIALVLAAAKLGGEIAVRMKQQAVLGEMLAGALLGSIRLPFVEGLKTDPGLEMLAHLGVLILLFEVGLESTVRDVLRVGFASARVALLGTIGTLVCGWAAAAVAMPQSSTLVHLFVAAAITATSIGISARVLKDAGAARSQEGHTILSAAVIDDVLGLVALAIVTGMVTRSAEGAAITPWAVIWLVVKTFGFLALAVLAGAKLSPALFRLTARLRTSGALLATGLSLCFVLAWASSAIGLAPIVGAFTAGLILEESHSAHFVQRGEAPLTIRVEPISSWLVPTFFVLMGMHSDFSALAHPRTLLLVLLLAVAAVVGKLACALGAPRGSNRLAIALGMIPRGEVSLVFANLGQSIGLLDAGQYSALVTVVIVTTLVTPAALRGQLRSQAVAA